MSRGEARGRTLAPRRRTFLFRIAPGPAQAFLSPPGIPKGIHRSQQGDLVPARLKTRGLLLGRTVRVASSLAFDQACLDPTLAASQVVDSTRKLAQDLAGTGAQFDRPVHQEFASIHLGPGVENKSSLDRRGHEVPGVSGRRRREPVSREDRSELFEKLAGPARDLPPSARREPHGKQSAEQTPRRGGPLDEPLVHVMAPRCGVVATPRKGNPKRGHSSSPSPSSPPLSCSSLVFSSSSYETVVTVIDLPTSPIAFLRASCVSAISGR